jgi:glycosyltransferase involved in cell wall biosynthesis
VTDSVVSVVIPTRDNVDELRRCIDSITSGGIRPRQVIVCVDGSTDGTLDYLESARQSETVLLEVATHPGNAHRGRAATRNLALDHLEGEYVWFVDSDMVLAPDALQEHLRLVSEQACVSQGQVLYSNAAEAVWAGYLATRAYHRSQDRAVIPFNWFSAANALIRTDHVMAIRGFDPRLAGYGGEDLDFAYRLQLMSKEPFVNNRRSVAATEEDKTVDQALVQFEEYGATNLHLIESLHPEMPRVYELERLESSDLKDRLFVAAVNPHVAHLVDRLLPVAPRRLRDQLLSYKLIAAVWRGYRSAPGSS